MQVMLEGTRGWTIWLSALLLIDRVLFVVYVCFNENGKLKNIVEKSIISDTFACGAYRFHCADSFLHVVQTCRGHSKELSIDLKSELAISDVIWRMMIMGEDFTGIECFDYQDWGTLSAWRSYCSTFRTLLVDIDGTLVENSGQYFGKRWGSTEALTANVKHLKNMYDTASYFDHLQNFCV